MSVKNSIIKKKVFNQRFINNLAREYIKELDRMYVRVIRRMKQEPNNTRLQAAERDLRRTLDISLQELSENIKESIGDFAENELDFLDKVFKQNAKAVTKLPVAGAVRRALARNDMDVLTGPNTLTVGEMIDKFSVSQKTQIRRIITDGVLMGDSIDDMTNKIARLSKTRTRAQAKALTSTLVNHASSQAKRQFVVENQALFESEQWVSVLDSKTTLICAGRHSNIYPVGAGPYPPAHYNCRSERVPMLKDDQEAKKQSKVKETFDSWLRKQNSDFQKEYFRQYKDGQEKYELFKYGGLEVQEFRDETGMGYTLEQLEALYPIAFREADLD